MRNSFDDKAVDWLVQLASAVFVAGVVLGAIVGTVLTLLMQRFIR